MIELNPVHKQLKKKQKVLKLNQINNYQINLPTVTQTSIQFNTVNIVSSSA
jgi:hypothetical protein